MAPATQLVGHPLVIRVVDNEQFAVVDLHAVHQTGVVSGPRPAPAAGLNLALAPLVGQLQQPPGPMVRAP